MNNALGLLDAVNLLKSFEQLAQAAPIPNPPPRMIGQRLPKSMNFFNILIHDFSKKKNII